MTVIVGPLAGTIEELLDEMERRGVAPGSVRAWRGPDHLWRGIGDVPDAPRNGWTDDAGVVRLSTKTDYIW